jgi:putative membrane protein
MSTLIENTPLALAADAGPTVRGTRRPAPALFGYYALSALLAGPGLVFLLPYRWFRYHTLRYEFDDDGVSMRWGILFRREVTLTYARIQDIHLVSNVVERWLGLGRVQIQTASGSAAAEMVIEGLPDYEQVRDALYARMRGAREQTTHAVERHATSALPSTSAAAALPAADASVELTHALQETARELRALRETLARERGR